MNFLKQNWFKLLILIFMAVLLYMASRYLIIFRNAEYARCINHTKEVWLEETRSDAQPRELRRATDYPQTFYCEQIVKGGLWIY